MLSARRMQASTLVGGAPCSIPQFLFFIRCMQHAKLLHATSLHVTTTGTINCCICTALQQAYKLYKGMVLRRHAHQMAAPLPYCLYGARNCDILWRP